MPLSGGDTFSTVRNLSTDELHNLLIPISRKPFTSISNWSKTFQCIPVCIFDPETEYQCELILELAKRRKVPLRATGVGHSPSDIACTNGFLICTLKLNRLLEVWSPVSSFHPVSQSDLRFIPALKNAFLIHHFTRNLLVFLLIVFKT